MLVDSHHPSPQFSPVHRNIPSSPLQATVQYMPPLPPRFIVQFNVPLPLANATVDFSNLFVVRLCTVQADGTTGNLMYYSVHCTCVAVVYI